MFDDDDVDNDLEWADEMMLHVNNKFRSQAIGYIAGFVVKMLQKIIKCNECMTACYGELDGTLKTYRVLLTLKNNGGLIIPSPDVINICVITDSIICYLIKIKSSCEIYNKSLDLKISQLLLKQIKMDGIFTELNDHDIDHKISLVRAIAICYTKIKKFHLIKFINHKPESSIRKRLSRLIINKCQ